MGPTILHTFTVTGMHCASCTMLIDETLEELPGVHRSQSSLRDRRTVVHATADVTTEALIAGIIQAGYQAAVMPR